MDEPSIEPAILAVDTANFALEGAQPNVVTLAGHLSPGGFVDERGVPDIGRLRSVIAERVRGVAALSRRPVERDGNWLWEPAEPDLTHHVRVAEARSGSAAEVESSLAAVCARVVMEPLAKDRPLWEILLIPGADGGRCGIVFRIHHAVADGFVAEQLIEALADPRGEARGADAGSIRTPPPDPPRGRLRAIRDRSIAFVMQSAALFRRTVRSRVLLGPLSGAREIAFADIGLSELHEGAHRLGATVNDAFLMAFGQGIRCLLAAAGEPPPVALPISCPVLLPRRRGQGNATGVMLASVPVASTDPREALRQVAAVTPVQKARARASGTFTWMRGPRAAAMLMRVARRQRAVAAIASEIAGPPSTLHFAGAELVDAWAVSLLSENVRVGVLGLSYAGRFRISVQTDAANVPPARVVSEGMVEALRTVAFS